MSNFGKAGNSGLEEELGIQDLDPAFKEFVLEVYQMRSAQDGFFKHFGSDWKAKRLRWEARVDKKIASLRKIPAENNLP